MMPVWQAAGEDGGCSLFRGLLLPATASIDAAGLTSPGTMW